MDVWTRHLERAFPVTAQRMGNGTWIAVWKHSVAHDEGYGHRHPDACFSAEELVRSADWHALVRARLGLETTD